MGEPWNGLRKKIINKNTYYYYSKWGWKDGKCRRLWQKYLGTLEKIAQSVDGGPPPAYAEVFQWGLPIAMWRECERTQTIEIVNSL